MDVLELRKKAIDVRIGAITLAHNSKGHIGGSMSSADILTAIYYRYLRFDPRNPRDPDRDRFILSKGHTCEGYLWILADCGFFDKSELLRFNCFQSRLMAHPSTAIDGVDFSTGALGHGLSLGCGAALGAKKSGKSFDTYVVMGDGETDEGSVWEAAMFASANHLDNLYAVIDRNHMQISGETENVMPLEPYEDKWRSFGFEVLWIDGNDMSQLVKAFDTLHMCRGKPKLIIADTRKGKGVSFMEGNAAWHHGTLDDAQYRLAVQELEAEREALKE